jgi:hypothetical protein
MIHIRYHLITVMAIFLALGVGILLGGTAGQSWFALKEQEFLSSMEDKYDKALKSNNELKQKLNQLIVQIERSNEEVLHLMAVRYAEDLQGSKVYVWHPETVEVGFLKRILLSVGVEVIPYTVGGTPSDWPLLVFGREKPAWLDRLPAECKWLHVQVPPDSPAKQWKLLEEVQTLLKEKRLEREKS